MSLIGLDKLALLRKAIKANGGVFRLLEKLWRMDTVKEGTLMGWDSNCNKYYENQRYMISRSRWVEFSPHYKWEYDASQVTPEWFGWLHYKTDQLPCQDCAKYCLNCCSCSHRWLLPPEENLTGTCCAYYPYSTTMSHIGLWDEFCCVPVRRVRQPVKLLAQEAYYLSPLGSSVCVRRGEKKTC